MKLVPWNWFINEEPDSGSSEPVHHANQRQLYNIPVGKLVNNFFSDFGDRSLRFGNFFFNSFSDGFLRPNLDIRSGDEEYTISIEVPGVEEQDIKLEIANNILTVSGKKKQENEDKKKQYYRMERSYGAFQRVLSLPEDVDQDEVNATFKNGVLTINIQKKALRGSEVKRIDT